MQVMTPTIDKYNDDVDTSFREGKNDNLNENERNKIAARSLGFSEADQRIVACSRFAFLFCLLASVTALASLAYYIGRRDEREEFEDEVGFGESCVLDSTKSAPILTPDGNMSTVRRSG